MALIEDMFKGNLAAGLAIGVGAIVFGPTVMQTMGSILQPAAKTLIKGSMMFYRETLSEVGEMAADLVAEARAELEQEPGAGATQEHHGAPPERAGRYRVASIRARRGLGPAPNAGRRLR